jgi:hypothetical protein
MSTRNNSSRLAVRLKSFLVGLLLGGVMVVVGMQAEPGRLDSPRAKVDGRKAAPVVVVVQSPTSLQP